MKAPLPEDEENRLDALYAYGILDTDADKAFDDLTELASFVCETPIALVSFVDRDRQWFKSKVGIEAEQTPRDVAFCAHAILGDDPLVVPDSHRDERFAANPLVTGEPNVRFYAGAPLITPDDHRIGTLCVIDHQPRELTAKQKSALQALARQVIDQLELRSKLALVSEKNRMLERLQAVNERMNASLVVKNEELEQFACIASHDLHAPLRGVKHLVEWIEEDSANAGLVFPDEVKEHFDDVKGQIARMSRLLDSVLEYARAGTDEGTNEAVDLKKLVANAIELATVPEGFNIVLSGEFPSVHCNQNMLQRVLLNLLTNAIKHHDRESGQIEIHCDPGADELRLTVRDDGPGIPVEHQERVFQMFERLTSSRVSDGAGIGLSTVRKLVNAVGGQVQIVPGPEGGTTFQVIWPLAEANGNEISTTDTRNP